MPRLYKEIRSNADYRRSLDLLKSIKKYDKNILTKSGVMLGLGETKGEVIEVLEDLSAIQCDIVTLGQYLRPSKYNVAVQEFVKPEVFENYKKIGLEMGFRLVISGPFVRSSYHAEEAFQSLEVKTERKSRYLKILRRCQTSKEKGLKLLQWICGYLI